MPAIERKRVVIVDDEGHIRLLLKAILRALPCDVVAEGRTGAEAVTLFRTWEPDLLLLDVDMPTKNGLEALAELTASYPSSRIVMLTARADATTVQNCLAAGAKGYIRKDTPNDRIKATVAEQLGLLTAA